MDRVAALLLAGLLAGSTQAAAYFAGGGKDAAKGNDCLIGYDGVDPEQVTVDGKKNVVVCTDCDPSCDLDGVPTANGSCTLTLGACINQSGVEGCDPPASLSKASAKGKVKGVKGSAGKIVIDVPQLLEGSACGAVVDVLIPVKETNKGAKDGKASLKLSASLKKDKAEGIAARSDKDKLNFVCQPRPEGEACPIPTTTTSSSTSTTVEPSTTSTTTTSSTSTSTSTSSSTSTTVEPTTTSTSTPPPSTTSTTVGPTTTSTTTIPPPSTTSTTVVTTTTTSTVPPPSGTVLAFTTGAAGGTCGEARTGGSSGTVLKTLTCGGLNIGGGGATVPEGPTPAGALTLFNTSCAGGSCTVTARTAAQTGSTTNCSDTGCAFGPYLSIPNGGLSTCVRNTFASPGGGTLDTATGAFDGSVPLSSAVNVTGNAGNPCPSCTGGTPGVAGSGTCDGTSTNSGAVCTPVNAGGDTHDCLPGGVALAPFGVDLTPIGTGTASKSGPSFCPGQDATAPGLNGCFGCRGITDATYCPAGAAGVCDYIEERGSDAGLLSTGAPHGATLASVFCIPATGNGLIDGSADLPGPGATSLPGSLELIP